VPKSWFLSHGNWKAAGQQAEAASRIDGTRVEAFALLAAVDAQGNQAGELEALLAAAERQGSRRPVVLLSGCGGSIYDWTGFGARRKVLARYLGAEPEGNAPTLSEARRKLEQILEKAHPLNAKRGTLGPG
jgi:hypothetical protein